MGDRLFTKTIEGYLPVGMLAGSKMKQKENTLIFIDEMQADPLIDIGNELENECIILRVEVKTWQKILNQNFGK